MKVPVYYALPGCPLIYPNVATGTVQDLTGESYGK